MRSEGGMKGHPLSCAVCVLPRLCRTLTDVTHEARKGLHHSTKMNHQDEQVSDLTDILDQRRGDYCIG
jgi:hypothetical protein